MSRAPPGGAGRLGLPGNNPRAAMGQPQGRQPSDLYGQGNYGDLRSPPSAPPRSPAASRYGEKSPGLPKAGGDPIQLRIEKVSDRTLQTELIYGNLCAVSPEDFPPSRDGTDLYILIRGGRPNGQGPVGEYVVTAKPVSGFPRGCITLSEPQRTWIGISLREPFTGELYDPFSAGAAVYLGSLDVEIGFASQNKKTETPYDEDELSRRFLDSFQNQLLSPGQRILMDVAAIPLMIIVKTISLGDLGMSSDDSNKRILREGTTRGILTNQTRVVFHRDAQGTFNLKPSASKPNSNAILAPDFKFEDMGIGGLGDEFSTIFRRAFASRVFPPGLVAKMGIPHVKGMLLYGPPGTGKTLIARQIGKMLNARPPKVINGPEVLNKYVGQSEENIRKLFADAEKEFKEKGDESGLHIIIFDELDAVCKQRGSGAGGGTGVGDSVVNQLLSKLDGVDQLNNILLIGMTNRKDMIDDALMRPGRLEVHLEISLPDEPGRVEIFNIHTSKMKSNGLLGEDVDFGELAGLTKNYSGAEINGVVKAAASFAFSRHSVVGQMAAVREDVVNMKVKREDFLNALTEVRPAFGVSEEELEEALRMGIIPYSAHVNHSTRKMLHFASMLKDEPEKLGAFGASVLFHGPFASGKTALAAHIAKQSGFPFIKMITPGKLVGYRDDSGKKDYLHRAFSDAHKSPASIVILDDFERLIGWTPIGSRFSSFMLEALTTFIRLKPPKGHRLLVFVTTSKLPVLQSLEVDEIFSEKIAVPAVSNLNELGIVLQNAFDSGDINQVLNTVRQRRAGSDSVGVGIKTIFDLIFQARAYASGGSMSGILDTFSEILLEKMEEMRG
ncbi:hypothetical protein HIM_00050 [Hirsutella minnesotensis 3608]|nr:hypothetical protein HIM_00050 [Hirsutella minnesotensis 3608]